VWHVVVVEFTSAKQRRNITSVRSLPMDVTLIRWPDEDEHRRQLAAGGHPRLLLVDEHSSPPSVDDPTEDWIRLPARDEDVRARVRTLLVRAGVAPATPAVDADGVLVVGSTHLPLPPVEARLTGVLLERHGVVVGREDLARAGWPDGMPSRNALDVRILRLRRRLEYLGLRIRTVRQRGYLLEVGEPASLVDRGARNGSDS
jgi:Transcriptional regulatory protein, C terminal